MFNYLSTAGRVILSKLFGRRYPLSVTHIITTRCNYGCVYCDMRKNKYNEITTEQIFKMLDEFSEMGLKRYGISGGEPLLRKDIGKIIDYAKGKKVEVSLFTNGSLVKDRISELTNLNMLLISLDGTEYENDKQRGEGAYKRAMEAIKLARENKIKVVVGMTLTKNNLNSIELIAKNAKEIGFSILVQPVYYYPKYSSSKEVIETLRGDEEQYKNTVYNIIKLKKMGYPILNSITYLKEMLNPYISNANKPCQASKLFCAITPEGGVSPCFKIYGQKGWLNGTEIGFKEAFLKIPKNFECCTCFSYATTEFNLLYSMKPEVIINVIKNLVPYTKNKKL